MVDIFKALAEESRLRILSLLLNGEMCVCEIEGSLAMKQSNVSRHLSALRESGILESYKQAQWTYYRISPLFKQEHHGLWEYLSDRLRKLPTYGADQRAYQAYRNANPCACGKE